jgi:Fe-S cluster assembly iron-binding protein IscA
VLEEASRLADDGTKLEFDGFKMVVDPLAAGSLQGAV